MAEKLKPPARYRRALIASVVRTIARKKQRVEMISCPRSIGAKLRGRIRLGNFPGARFLLFAVTRMKPLPRNTPAKPPSEEEIKGFERALDRTYARLRERALA